MGREPFKLDMGNKDYVGGTVTVTRQHCPGSSSYIEKRRTLSNQNVATNRRNGHLFSVENKEKMKDRWGGGNVAMATAMMTCDTKTYTIPFAV